MQTIDKLLANYKTLNDKLSQSNELNEKDFKEEAMKNIKKSFSILDKFERKNLLILIAGIFYFSYAIYKCRDKTDLFVMSIVFMIGFLTYSFFYFKSIKWEFFTIKSLNENDLLKTLRSVKDLQLTYRKWITPVYLLPACLLYILQGPIMIYVQSDIYYLNIIYWQLENAPVTFLIELAVLGLLIFIVWSWTKWNISILKGIEDNLKVLENTE